MKINTSNTRGFKIMLFYLKEDYKVPKDLAKISSIVVQPILFLSKLLSPIRKELLSNRAGSYLPHIYLSPPACHVPLIGNMSYLDFIPDKEIP